MVVPLCFTLTVTCYTTWPKVCGYLFFKHLIPKTWPLIWSWSPLCCYNSLHSSGRLSTRCWNIAAGTCFHSATRALVRSDTDHGQLALAHNWHSNSSQRCSMGLTSGLCADQSRSSTLISSSHFCMGAFKSNQMYLYSPSYISWYLKVLYRNPAWNLERNQVMRGGQSSSGCAGWRL